MITRDEALRRVKEHVENQNLVKHMIAVSAIMRGLAKRRGEDPDLWEAVGMLHDIDYEKFGDDFHRHGVLSADMLTAVLSEAALHAIRAHNPRTGVPADSEMAVALIATDALSGLVVATALMMPDKRLATVRVSSLMRKFKDGSFARNVSREDISRCGELVLSLEEFFALGLTSMQAVSDELGL